MKIHDGVSVDVYRNLHKNTWSIRSRTTGRIVGHADQITVRAAKFVVQPAGRQRVLKEQRKNVHAFVRGIVTTPLQSHARLSIGISTDGSTEFEAPCVVQVKYNPYRADHFYEAETGEAVEQASVVVLDTEGAWIQESASSRRVALDKVFMNTCTH